MSYLKINNTDITTTYFYPDNDYIYSVVMESSRITYKIYNKAILLSDFEKEDFYAAFEALKATVKRFNEIEKIIGVELTM